MVYYVYKFMFKQIHILQILKKINFVNILLFLLWFSINLIISLLSITHLLKEKIAKN